MGGGRGTFDPYRELVQLLFDLTVMPEAGSVRLYTSEDDERVVLGGWTAVIAPLPLKDGRYLRFAQSLFLGDSPDKGLFNVLKVRTASAQYQLDEEGDRWVFRYDYLREQGDDPHPQAHLQVRGYLEEAGVLRENQPLERVHFPTGRFSIEAVIRLLIEQFGVEPNAPAEVWRPALAESEREFLRIAHTVISGPEG